MSKFMPKVYKIDKKNKIRKNTNESPVNLSGAEMIELINKTRENKGIKRVRSLW